MCFIFQEYEFDLETAFPAFSGIHGTTLEMLPGQSTEWVVSVKMIHGLIKMQAG